ncbi:hypothetical protein [Rufibacter sp. XAAS-G3-1]|uniref:hypothetical protein n=1 Tax=Rufibacter sp. XAAS-G3-1 TaxID=2729134 RepID=UPI0015E66A1F|nr:hypothetical protein [Rufibacter sp. XAAS-G3-1]
MKKADQDGSSSAKDQKEKQVITLFYQPLASPGAIPRIPQTISYAVSPEDRPVGVPLSIFHPPKPTV